jgi:hypothetical protein
LLAAGVLDELKRSFSSYKDELKRSALDDGRKHRPKHVELAKKIN